MATTENRRLAAARAEKLKAESRQVGTTDGLLTRPGLAAALQVSVCTVDRMMANGDVPCIRVRGRVRFCLADVVEALRSGDRKFGRKAALAGNPKSDQPKPEGNPKPEVRSAELKPQITRKGFNR